MILFAIDPGVKACALAAFKDGVLFSVTNTLHWLWGPLHGDIEIVCERMRVYPDILKKKPAEIIARTNDLIACEGAGRQLVGEIQGAALGSAKTSFPTAPEWKAQTPKPIHHNRALRALAPSELAILEALKPGIVEYVEKACRVYAKTKTLDGYRNPIHNALDVVALGLKHLRRIN